MTVPPPLMPAVPATEEDPFAGVSTSADGIAGKAGRMVLISLGVFAAWAVFVPLDSAVVAPTELTSGGRNQLIQHVSGGTVTAIRAHDGDLVEQDQVILELDPALDQARLTKLRARHAVLSALRNRLVAQKGGAPGSDELDLSAMQLRLPVDRDIDYSTTASLGKDGFRNALDAEQAREFETGRKALGAQLRGLSQRLEGQRATLAALSAQVDDAEHRARIFADQLDGARTLADAGNLARQQVWTIESQAIDATAQLLELKARIASTRSDIGETEAEVERLTMADGRDTSQQLTDTLAELEQISDELSAAEQARTQASLRSPARGHLVRLAATTIGGVIKPGETVAEIVPADAPLVARARVPVDKIASVHLDQEAKVRITALNPRTHDALPATVTYVAADASLDERTGERFFEVRAELDAEAVRNSDTELTPGMAGEVFIEGGSRSFLSYLMQPFLDGLSHTFREVH